MSKRHVRTLPPSPKRRPLASNQRTIPQGKFAKALEFHFAGRLADAERVYGSILQQDPKHFDARHMLGLALLQQGRFEEAEEQLGLAVRMNPNVAAAHNNRGLALKELKRLEPALAAFDKAIALQPNLAEAFDNRGNALTELGCPNEAIASYDRAIAFKPNAGTFNNRGAALQALGRFKEALANYEAAIALKPEFPEAFNHRGLALHELGRLREALSSFDKAIVLRSDYAEAFGNRANALADLGRFDEALTSFEKAIDLRPGYSEAFANLSNALADLGRFEEALTSCNQAVALKPTFAEALISRSRLRLLFGQFAQGWDEFEYRWRTKRFHTDCRADVDPEQLSLWAGKEALRKQRVLVVAEQGVGDEIMFSSMIPDLVGDAAHITLECDPRLGALFSRSFPKVGIIPRESPPIWRAADFDVLVPSGSLGRLYRNSPAEFPVRQRYLQSNEDIVLKWRERLSDLGDDLKVGISWKGGTDRTRRMTRSIPLELWRPIFDVEGVSFVSLQYGDVTSEIEDAKASLPKPIICFEPSQIGDFDNLMGLVEALDLVISVQTSLVHLSGAGGKRCWVMVPYAAEWRYGLQTSMPWYGSVKLYRQKDRGEWPETIGNVGADLATFAKNPDGALAWL